jgi:hypothetical protein
MAGEPGTVRSVEASTAFNGVDFVEVVAPRVLHVHFLNGVAIADPAIAATIDGGDRVPTVPLKPIDNAADWSTDSEGRPLLTLTALSDGDFSFYRLTITAPKLDLVLNTTLPVPPPHVCRPTPAVPPIDYLAKVPGFPPVLTEFSVAAPPWVNAEADFGAMAGVRPRSATGQLLQDRVAAEASLPRPAPLAREPRASRRLRAAAGDERHNSSPLHRPGRRHRRGRHPDLGPRPRRFPGAVRDRRRAGGRHSL